MADDASSPPRRLQVETLGCRLNIHESLEIERLAAEVGLKDAVVVNSCAVTAEAVRQTRQAVRKARRARPDAAVVVTGCAAQIETDAFAAMPEVDWVLGNQEKLSADAWAAVARGPAEGGRIVADIAEARSAPPPPRAAPGARARAIVQVQNGCDHSCTFCVIPQGRGPARSTPAAQVVDQVRRAVDAGRREVVLSGVDLTSWGADLSGHDGRTPRLGDLVSHVLRSAPDLPRLRLSSIDGVEIDDALWETIEDRDGDGARLAPHLHLSLQAGHDLILKRMKRRHLTADARAVVARVRAARPEAYLGADVIAGFPTETDAMATATREHLDELGIEHLHVFPYSPRPGTPAARMPPVAPSSIKARAGALRADAARRLSTRLEGELGRVHPVLMERARLGRTPAFAPVAFERDLPVGEIVAARIVAAAADRLKGAPVEVSA